MELDITAVSSSDNQRCITSMRPSAIPSKPTTTRNKKSPISHNSPALQQWTMATVVAALSSSSSLGTLLHLLPESCKEEFGRLDAEECKERGALAVYGQWSSCSSFSPSLHQCVEDPHVLQHLVATALSSNDSSCLQLLLMLASASVSANTSAFSAWLNAGMFPCLLRAFAADQAVATRKLAFDFAFVIVQSRLRIENDGMFEISKDFGFGVLVQSAGGAECPAAAREYQVASLFVVRQPANTVRSANAASACNALHQILLSSITAQCVPHYPFMPLKFFDNVAWPMQDATPCHARLRSLMSLYPPPPPSLPPHIFLLPPRLPLH